MIAFSKMTKGRFKSLFSWWVILLATAQVVHAGGGTHTGANSFPTGSRPVLVAQAQSEIAESGDASAVSKNRESVNVKLRDLELIDQDGKKVNFASEVVGDRVAVIIPFYTTCTTAYPILIYIFTRLQDLLGDRLGRDVVLVSVTVDPRTDIPIRLKAYARRQKAKPGWVFLTGERDNLGQVLWGVGVLFSSNLEEHNHIPVTIVGTAHGDWRRFHGFPTPEQLLAQVGAALTVGK